MRRYAGACRGLTAPIFNPVFGDVPAFGVPKSTFLGLKNLVFMRVTAINPQNPQQKTGTD